MLKHLNSPEPLTAQPRPLRGSRLDPYTHYIDQRVSKGLENCRVLLREIRGLGYEGSYSTVADYVRPRRRRRQARATVRFETAAGEQAQVDWGSFSYLGEDGRQHRIWAFVMVLGWSRAIYVELVRRADTASFIQCHVNAFEYFGGMPRRCLYDNAKVVTLGRDAEGQVEWNRRMLDFALRIGFELRLCQPYRAQTKGKVESGVKYVRGNLWPSLRFTDDADLNRQAVEWCTTVANHPAGLAGVQGIGYDYVLGSGGVYVQSQSGHLTARVLVAPGAVRGLASVAEKVQLTHGPIPAQLFELGLRWFQDAPDTERFFAVRWDGEGYRLVVPPQAGTATRLAYQPPPGVVAEFHSQAHAPSSRPPTIGTSRASAPTASSDASTPPSPSCVSGSGSTATSPRWSGRRCSTARSRESGSWARSRIRR